MTDERSRPGGLSRRQLLGAALGAPLLNAVGQRGSPLPGLPDVRKAPYRVIGGPGAERLTVTRAWSGANACTSRIHNPTGSAVPVKEVILFELSLRTMPGSSLLYGEGFQMLTQTAGTLGAPVDAGSYTDAGHYKIPTSIGARTFYGLTTLSGAGDSGPRWTLGFTSCRRFAGFFRLHDAERLDVVIDAEGLTLGPGETWDLEEYCHDIEAPDRRPFAARIAINHPPLSTPAPPTGWCSWYCFGAKVTAQNVLDNLETIERKIPGLTYVQIDDGYQPAMGDWLETGPAFGGDVRKVLDAIKTRGFQPAIWVAPFVAEEQSHVFRQHPDWFVKAIDGSPLRSDTVTFGGWRRGPWYVLDGTHPAVQAHLEHVFATMNREWGVTYFKLDANFWGAIHGGRFHDPNATRIEAYRRGMEAIRKGAGKSFILGCNHPIWPSFGLIHGSRSSNDIKRTWDRIKTTAQQNLLRNWQNGRLWWNDPDAICLSGDLPENEFLFHATAIYATGGMLLSGDDLSTLPEPRLAMLKRLLPPTGVAAVFDDDRLRIGSVALPGREVLCCFNWTDAPATLVTRLADPVRVTDFWTGAPLGRIAGQLTLENMPPRSARLLECTRG